MGGRRPPPEPVDPAIAALIKRKARTMARTRADREDAEQELWLAVSRAMPRFNPIRAGKRTFARHVVNNRATDIVRACKAAKRDRKRTSQFEDGAGTRVTDHRAPAHHTDLAIDLRAEFESSSAEQKAIATLFELHSEAEVARITNLSRQQVRGLKAKLAEQLRRAGLDPHEESSTEQPTLRGKPYIKGIGRRRSRRET